MFSRAFGWLVVLGVCVVSSVHARAADAAAEPTQAGMSRSRDVVAGQLVRLSRELATLASDEGARSLSALRAQLPSDPTKYRLDAFNLAPTPESNTNQESRSNPEANGGRALAGLIATVAEAARAASAESTDRGKAYRHLASIVERVAFSVDALRMIRLDAESLRGELPAMSDERASASFAKLHGRALDELTRLHETLNKYASSAVPAAMGVELDRLDGEVLHTRDRVMAIGKGR